MNGTFASINGIDLYHEVHGTGPRPHRRHRPTGVAHQLRRRRGRSAFEGWSDAAIGGIAGPTLIIVGDHDFVRLEHAVLMLELFPDAQLAVLPGTTHMQVIRRTDVLLDLVEPFVDGRP